MTKRTMKPTVYIAGPMRGLPDYNREAFAAAAQRLAADWRVLNPLDFERAMPCTDEAGQIDEDALEALLAVEREAVRHADAIYLLRGWERSDGARRELAAFLEYPLEGRILVEGEDAAK